MITGAKGIIVTAKRLTAKQRRELKTKTEAPKRRTASMTDSEKEVHRLAQQAKWARAYRKRNAEAVKKRDKLRSQTPKRREYQRLKAAEYRAAKKELDNE